MSTQFEMDFEVTSLYLKDIPVGDCFCFAHKNDFLPTTYMRVAPVKSLVRSTMVHEVLTRGDCFVLCVNTGQFTVMSYNTPVRKLNVTVKCSHV